MIDFFTSLDFVRRRTAGHRPAEVIAVARDPSAEAVAGFPHPDFELAGFDLVDAQFSSSVIFNPGRFPGAVNVSKLSAESGGGYFELGNTADLSQTFERVADELHRQYALGFAPEKLDGKTHKLEVRVNRPGMTARARRSYVAAAGR